MKSGEGIISYASSTKEAELSKFGLQAKHLSRVVIMDSFEQNLNIMSDVRDSLTSKENRLPAITPLINPGENTLIINYKIDLFYNNNNTWLQICQKVILLEGD